MVEKVTIHRDNGETAVVDAIDGRETVKRHPDEWSMEPFKKAEQSAALKEDIAAAKKKVATGEKSVAEAKSPEDKSKAEQVLADAKAELQKLEDL